MSGRQRKQQGKASVGRKLWIATIFLVSAPAARSVEGPFFITYTHQMEEPGNLEMSIKADTGSPSGGNRFFGAAAELEYGIQGWWTTELYLDGQSTIDQSTIFTGYRWENRFRIVPGEHWINPVLYVEFENIDAADKTLLEVVGRDGESDLADPNDEARRDKQREIETKLILSSYFKGWTVAENFIAEKNVRHEPYEFGYAVGVSRPLALIARPDRCEFCRENFQAGLEVYGGLGTYSSFGLSGTSHYVAPTLGWISTGGTMFRVSPAFGVTATSARFLMRVSATYEIAQLGRAVRKMLRAH